MEKSSLWKSTVTTNPTNQLNQNIETDILIIGGGITGITSAYYLKDKQVTLIDKGEIGMGVTANTTGKLTFLQDQIYLDIIKAHNEPTAYHYYLSQKEAIKQVTNIIKENNINCNLEENQSITFTNNEKEIKNIKKLESFFNKYNIEFGLVTNLPIDFPCKYGLKVNDTYVFNPLKYLNTLKEIIIKNKVNVYENTKAIELNKENDYYLVKTENNTIKAKQVIVATHYPFFVKPGFIPFKSHISKSYVIASKTDQNLKFNAITNTSPVYSFRYYNNKDIYFIYSSLSHPNSRNLNYEENYEKLIDTYQQQFKHKISHIWSTHDVMTTDHIPYIGELKENLYIATGYNKWGMTNGSMAGKLISDLINNKNNKYEDLFKIKRQTSLNRCSNCLYSNYLTSSTLINNKFKSNKPFYNENVYIAKINGRKVGIYIDEKNKKHIVSNICPHMKCNLIFNAFDKTWDCPCHGSRFDIDGNVIEGPSVYNIKLEKKID